MVEVEWNPRRARVRITMFNPVVPSTKESLFHGVCEPQNAQRLPWKKGRQSISLEAANGSAAKVVLGQPRGQRRSIVQRPFFWSWP